MKRNGEIIEGTRQIGALEGYWYSCAKEAFVKSAASIVASCLPLYGNFTWSQIVTHILMLMSIILLSFPKGGIMRLRIWNCYVRDAMHQDILIIRIYSMHHKCRVSVTRRLVIMRRQSATDGFPDGT